MLVKIFFWLLELLPRQITALAQQQVRSDDDASEVGILGHIGTTWGILGHFGTFWAFWDILGQFGRLFDEFGPFRLFSDHFHPLSANLKKRVTDPQTHGKTLL